MSAATGKFETYGDGMTTEAAWQQAKGLEWRGVLQPPMEDDDAKQSFREIMIHLCGGNSWAERDSWVTQYPYPAAKEPPEYYEKKSWWPTYPLRDFTEFLRIGKNGVNWQSVTSAFPQRAYTADRDLRGAIWTGGLVISDYAADVLSFITLESLEFNKLPLVSLAIHEPQAPLSRSRSSHSLMAHALYLRLLVSSLTRTVARLVSRCPELAHQHEFAPPARGLSV